MHPVAGMGALLAAGHRRFAHGSRLRLRVAGGAVVLSVALVAGAAGWLIVALATALGPAGLLVEAMALKALLSVRDLAGAALAVARDLDRDDLPSARAVVGTHLVSRPTWRLDATAVASAAIESTGENLTDSVLAPLLFYGVFGVPGAAVYRVVNTADAMFGYRRGELEDFGKLAARLDDALNLVPAPLAGFLLVAAAAVTRGRPLGALRTMWRQHARTASPNAGWTMAAMAGALGLTLTKIDHYRLGDGRQPLAEDVRLSVRVMVTAVVIGAGLLAIVLTVLR